MFQSWHTTRQGVEPAKTKFWLTFQLISDGVSPLSPLPPSSTPHTFPLFPLLPPELRLEIWSYLLTPRILLLACHDSRTSPLLKHKLSLRPSLPPTPVLLLISRETRALALRHYELTFPWKLPPRLASPEAHCVLTSGPARVWFNFSQDTLLLFGELEPFDEYGFNSPMVYFLRREDCARVRHVAVAYEELGLGVYESEGVFGSVFHVVDRFVGAERLLVTVTERDKEVSGVVTPARENVVQKLWAAWVNGVSVVTSSLASKQILMIREDELPGFVAWHS